MKKRICRYLFVVWVAIEAVLAAIGAATIAKLLMNAGYIPCHSWSRFLIGIVCLLALYGSLGSRKAEVVKPPKQP